MALRASVLIDVEVGTLADVRRVLDGFTHERRRTGWRTTGADGACR